MSTIFSRTGAKWVIIYSVDVTQKRFVGLTFGRTCLLLPENLLNIEPEQTPDWGCHLFQDHRHRKTINIRLNEQFFRIRQFWRKAPKMTVVKNQNDRYPKWPLSKMTVNFAPKWPMFQNDRYLYQNDRYCIPKWPLFEPKWPLFLGFQVTVILDNPKWPLIEIV